MKLKKFLLMDLTILLAMSLFGCAKETNVDVQQNETTTLKFVNSKSEVKEQINQLAAQYEAETGIKVEVETINSGVDVQATLKGMYLADKMPDIIVCEAADFSNWDGLLIDQSGAEWISRTDAAFKDEANGIVGFPFTTEAIGLIYNKTILNKAGIDPDTITTVSAMEQALQMLDSKKDSLGLTAVVGYCAEPENVGWSSGNHIFGNYLDSGLSRDDTTYIDKLMNEKTLDADRFKHFSEFMKMLQDYSDQKLLLSGTYDEQVNNFAAGKYAFVTQGSWIGATMTGAAKDLYSAAGNFEVGMLPYVFEDGIDTILTNSPSWWTVTKEGNAEEALKFLQWCSEDSAQKILVENAGFVSPFTDCKYVATDPFAPVIANYISAGKTSSWHWQDMPTGLGQNHLSFAFFNYANGTTDANGFHDEITSILSEQIK